MNKNKRSSQLLRTACSQHLKFHQLPPTPNIDIYGTVLLLEAGSRNSINYQSKTGATFDREVSIKGVRSDKGTLFFHLRAPR